MEKMQLEGVNTFGKIESIDYDSWLENLVNSINDHTYSTLLNGNPEEVYSLLDTIRRRIVPLENIAKLMRQAYDEDPVRLIDFLDDRRRIIENFLNISCCAPDILIYFIQSDCVANSYLLYESMEQLLIRGEGDIDELILLAISKLNKVNDIRWRLLIKKPEIQRLIIANLDRLIKDFSDHQIEVFISTTNRKLTIKEDIKLVCDVINRISDEDLDLVRNKFSKPLYEKWLHSLENDKGTLDFFNNMLLNDAYIIFIGDYICYIHEENIEKLSNEIIKNIKILQYELTIWYKSSSHMITNYFINLTKIYVLVFSYKYIVNNDTNVDLVENINILKKIIFKYRYLCCYSDEESLKKLDEILSECIKISSE